MKKFLAILLGVIFIIGGGVAFADRDYDSPSTLKADKEKGPKGAYECPVSHYTEQDRCEKCHEMRKVEDKWGWHIKPQKAKNPKRLFRFPNYIRIVNGKAEGYFEIRDIYPKPFATFCDYMREINIKKVTIDIYSGGGALFGGVSIASMIMEMQRRDVIVTTQVHSFAASAAMVVLIASDIRLVNDYAMIMWHELMVVEGWFLKLTTPSSKEDEARILRKLQDNMNRYIADKTGMDKAEIDDIVHRMEWWITGQEAVELGIATGYIE